MKVYKGIDTAIKMMPGKNSNNHYVQISLDLEDNVILSTYHTNKDSYTQYDSLSIITIGFYQQATINDIVRDIVDMLDKRKIEEENKQEYLKWADM